MDLSLTNHSDAANPIPKDMKFPSKVNRSNSQPRWKSLREGMSGRQKPRTKIPAAVPFFGAENGGRSLRWMVSPWQGYGNMSVLTIRTNQNVIGLNHPPKKASSNIQTAPIVWSLLYVFQSPTQLCFLGRYLTASFIPVSGLQLEAVASVKPLGVLQMTCPGKKAGQWNFENSTCSMQWQTSDCQLTT